MRRGSSNQHGSTNDASIELQDLRVSVSLPTTRSPMADAFMEEDEYLIEDDYGDEEIEREETAAEIHEHNAADVDVEIDSRKIRGLEIDVPTHNAHDDGALSSSRKLSLPTTPRWREGSALDGFDGSNSGAKKPRGSVTSIGAGGTTRPRQSSVTIHDKRKSTTDGGVGVPVAPLHGRRKALQVVRPRSGTAQHFPRFTNLDYLQDADDDFPIRLSDDNPLALGIHPSLIINKSRTSTMISDVRPDLFNSWQTPSPVKDLPPEIKLTPRLSSFSFDQFTSYLKSWPLWVFRHYVEGWTKVPVRPMDIDDEEEDVAKFYCLRPGSPFSRSWKLIMFFVNIFVMSSAPFEAAFMDQLPSSVLILEAFMELLMIIDIVINFHRGFKSRRTVVMTPRRLLWSRYFHGRFALDFLTAFPFSFISTGLGGGQAITVQSLRFIRVFRVYRVYLFLEKWEVRTLQPYRIRLSMLCGSVIYVTHIVGCMWYGFGNLNGFGADEWEPGQELEGMSIWEKYSRSIYWAFVVMMQPGPTEDPKTTGEIYFTIFTMTVGVAITATAIGTLGTLFMQLDLTRAHHQQLTEEVNQYLKYRNVPRRLKSEVRDYFNYVWERHRGINEANFLQLLPRYLRLRLNMHVNAEIIRKVSFFKNIPPRVLELLLDRMMPLICVPLEIIVYEGDKGEEMYFINSGEVEVYKNADLSVTRTMADGQCFGEMALLSGGLRAANVRAKTYCELFVLKKVDFDQVIAGYPDLEKSIRDVSQRRNSLKGVRPTSVRLGSSVVENQQQSTNPLLTTISDVSQSPPDTQSSNAKD